MKTITIKGGLFVDTCPYGDKANPYTFFRGVDRDFSTYVFIQPHTMTCEVPDDFDPRPAQIKALEAQRRELEEKFSAAVTEINARINSLLAIEMTP